MRLLLTLFLLYSFGVTSRQELVPPIKDELAKAPLVKIDELIAQPERYDKQLVRVNALWTNGYHSAFVCTIDNQKNCIAVSLRCPGDESCEDITKMLESGLESKPQGEFWERSGRFRLAGRFRVTKDSRHNTPIMLLEVWNIEGVISKPKG